MAPSTRRAMVLIDGVHKVDNSIHGIRELAEKHGFTPVQMVLRSDKEGSPSSPVS